MAFLIVLFFVSLSFQDFIDTTIFTNEKCDYEEFLASSIMDDSLCVSQPPFHIRYHCNYEKNELGIDYYTNSACTGSPSKYSYSPILKECTHVGNYYMKQSCNFTVPKAYLQADFYSDNDCLIPLGTSGLYHPAVCINSGTVGEQSVLVNCNPSGSVAEYRRFNTTECNDEPIEDIKIKVGKCVKPPTPPKFISDLNLDPTPVLRVMVKGCHE